MPDCYCRVARKATSLDDEEHVLGVREFDTIRPAGAGRCPAHRVGAPGRQATRPAGQQDLLTAGVAAPGRIAGPGTLALASGGRIDRVGAALLQLQRHYGNRYVQHVISSSRQAAEPSAAPALQAKVVVGPADDHHEREADRAAEQVTRLPAARQQQRENQDTSGVRAGPSPRHPHARASGVLAARAPGRSLPASLKEEFEAAFGADLGAVRVHTGDQAAQLSRGLQAQAFTHGPDVFFGAGRYAPGTAAGRRLLAHELTHVVQQGWAPPGRQPGAHGPSVAYRVPAPRGYAAAGNSGQPIQRKLSFEHTEWTEARTAWPSKGGARGVVFVTDELLKAPRPSPGNDPVVVKTGEDAPAEVLLAANLHSYGRDWAAWPSDAPAVRTVSPAEGEQIRKHVANRIFYAGPPEGLLTTDQQARALTIINRAGGAGTMVFEYAPGADFQKLLKQPGHSEKKLGGKPGLRKDSPARLFKDKDFMRSLGRIATIDIFTGNTDRLAGIFNPENFKIDQKTILLIDNVYYKMPQSAFKTSVSQDFPWTSGQSFGAWTEVQWTMMLQQNDLAGITHLILERIKGGIEGTLGIRQPDAGVINRAVDKAGKWLVEGLEQGVDWLLVAARDLDRLTRGIAPEDVQEIQTSIMNRMHFLFPNVGFIADELAKLERQE